MQIILNDHKLACVVVPKCACTSIKHFLFEVETGNPFVPDQNPNQKSTNIHAQFKRKYLDSANLSMRMRFMLGKFGIRKFADRLIHPASKIKFYKFLSNYATVSNIESLDRKYEDCYKIAVIRDPVSRILSCYNDKVVVDRYYSKLTDKASLMEKYKLPTQPTFSEFVSNLETYQGIAPNIWWHSRPLHFTLGRDPKLFDRIFTIKELESFASLVREKTGSNATMASHNNSFNKMKNKSAGLEKAVATAEDIALIKKKYASDYEIYGQFFKNIPTKNIKSNQTKNTNFGSNSTVITNDH